MTNSNGNFNVKETPRGQKRRSGDCYKTPTHNLQQKSEDWVYIGDGIWADASRVKYRLYEPKKYFNIKNE